MAARMSADRRGFSLLELIISRVMALVILGSVVQVMITQSRGYRKQREIVDIRDTSRQAASLLAWDLRQSVIGEGPLAAMGANSIAIRSPRAVGSICGKHATLARYGIWKSAGEFSATDADTAVYFARTGIVENYVRSRRCVVSATAAGKLLVPFTGDEGRGHSHCLER